MPAARIAPSGALGRIRLRRAGIPFALRPENAAPVLVVGNGHSALDTDANPLTGFGLAGKQLFQNGHGFSGFTPL
jgi:hypothetical protein